MDFTHIIITRFNVLEGILKEFPRNSPSWLNHRFELFQRYCFPSVMSQELDSFTWLLLFDADTPKLFEPLIKAYARDTRIVPVACDSERHYLEYVHDFIQRHFLSKWLITTRLDNDDALSRYYTAFLQQIVASNGERFFLDKGPTFVNFLRGYQLCDGVVYDFEDATNAFVSLVELRENARTVFHVDHPAIAQAGEVLQIQAEPLWLQVVHGTNAYNYIRGTASSKDNPLADFDLNLDR